MIELKHWMLPLIVAALAVPLVAGFLVAGPALGMALGFIAAATVVVVAARLRPGGRIETVAGDFRRHLLVVVSHELDDQDAIDRIDNECDLDGPGGVQVLVLAPATTGFFDRWASDSSRARADARRRLEISVASLREETESPVNGAIGDPDIVQAVEDSLRAFPATQVVLVTGTPSSDPAGERAAAELARRLDQPQVRIVLNGS